MDTRTDRRRPRHAQALVGVLLVALVLTVPGAGRVLAHAGVEETTPASGSTVSTSPETIVIVFDEDVEVANDDGAGVRLFDGAGRELTLPPATSHGHEVRVIPPQLPDGGYVVEWRVVSADGHPVHGAFTFGVGGNATLPAAPIEGSDSPLVSSVGSIARALAASGSGAAIGILVFALGVSGSVLGSARGRRTLRIVLGVALAGTAIQLMIRAPYVRGSGLGDAFDPGGWWRTLSTRDGRCWAGRAIALGVLARNGSRERRSILSWGLPAAVVVASFVGAGHGATGAHPLVGAVATTLHVVAMSVWFGGLMSLVVGVDLLEAGVAARRWSPVAALAVTVIVLSGSVQAWRQVAAWNALDTTYGRLLLAKVAAVGVMGVLGLVGRRHLLRGDTIRAVRRSVTVEVSMALVVFAVTGVLSATPPARESSQVSSTPSAPSTTATPVAPAIDVMGHLGDRMITVRASNATAGTNTVDFDLDDSSAPLTGEVTLRARAGQAEAGIDPVPLPVTATGARSWRATDVELPVPGDWRVEVFVDTPSDSLRFVVTLHLDLAGN